MKKDNNMIEFGPKTLEAAIAGLDEEEKKLFKQAQEYRKFKIRVLDSGLKLKYHERQQILACSSIEELKGYKKTYNKLQKAGLV